MTTDLSPETALFARRLARRHARRLPSQVDPADLIPIALFAAWRAEQTYDGTRGMRRTSWIMRSVQHALLEYTRSEDHLTRPQRRKYGDDLPPQYRPPLWIDTLVYDEGDETVGEMLSGGCEVDRDGMTPGLWAGWVQALLSELPTRERLLLTWIFLEEATIKESGRRLCISESRADQLKKRGLARCRERLGHGG